MGFLIRWLAAFSLAVAIYNPTNFSYVRWAIEKWDSQTPIVALVGLLLLVILIVFLTAVLRGIGKFGVLLIVLVLAALCWVFYDLGWIGLDTPTANIWIALLMISFVLAVGMYWGILWRRISGQLEVDSDSAA